jgi:hypothetical protein
MTKLTLVRLHLFSLLLILISGGVFGQERAEQSEQQGEAQAPETLVPEEESPQAILDALREDALLVDILAQVESDDDTILWSMQFREITVYGKGVQIRINGLNLTIEAEFTPFTQNNGEVVLLAKGQTWIRDQESKEVQYQSAFTSVPIVLGDPVIFYPLGVDSQEAGLGKANLILNINIQSLSELLTLDQEGK